jgi:hypothetical protein
MIKYGALLITLFGLSNCFAQTTISPKKVNVKQAGTVSLAGTRYTITWRAGVSNNGRLVLNLKKDEPLFSSISLSKNGVYRPVIQNVDPQFILTEGKRDLVSQNGWNIFFDKVPLKPHQSILCTLPSFIAQLILKGRMSNACWS